MFILIKSGSLLTLKLVSIWKNIAAEPKVSDIKKTADAYVIQKPAINSPAVDSMSNDELKELIDVYVSGVKGNYIFKTWPQFDKEF